MKRTKKVLRKGTTTFLPFKNLKYVLDNPHRWDVVYIMEIPENKFVRERYFNGKLSFY